MRKETRCTVFVHYALTIRSGLRAEFNQRCQEFVVRGIFQPTQGELHETLRIAQLQCKLEILSVIWLHDETASRKATWKKHTVRAERKKNKKTTTISILLEIRYWTMMMTEYAKTYRIELFDQLLRQRFADVSADVLMGRSHRLGVGVVARVFIEFRLCFCARE